MGNRNGDALYTQPQNYGTKGKSMGKSKLIATKTLAGVKGGPSGKVQARSGAGKVEAGRTAHSAVAGKTGWGVKAGPTGKVGTQKHGGKVRPGTGSPQAK